MDKQMKKIGIFYSFNTTQTASVAEKIAREIGEEKLDKINAEDVDEKTFMSYDNMILGAPTWFDGELPNYWDEFVPAIEDMDLNGKTIAIFGNGDQKRYPENFVDAIGLLAELLQARGAKIVGETPSKGYKFESSRALKGKKFMGLAIDNMNQKKHTDERVKKWVQDILKAFQ
jgi:flavodoxin I